MFKKYLVLWVFIMSQYLVTSSAQELVVVSIQGVVKVGNVHDPESSYKNLSYGLLNSDQVLLLGKNCQVKLIHLNGSVWEFKQPGRYLASSIKGVKDGFVKKSSKDGFSDNSAKEAEKSTLSQFGDYFLSFFQEHGSSESKESYNNSVYAISRGEPSIVLEFPFTGIYPSNQKSINFSWAHACDTCTYELSIFKDKSKALVFKIKTKNKTFNLKNPSKYLVEGGSYFWNVTTPSDPENFTFNRLSISKTNDYTKITSNMEKDIDAHLPNIAYVTKTILMLSRLQNEEKINYALLYSQQMMLEHSQDKVLQDFIDRYYYDELKKKLNN
ncbi:MAG: hypothetical protein ABI851_04270 [Saprospiraceae bacterium]